VSKSYSGLVSNVGARSCAGLTVLLRFLCLAALLCSAKLSSEPPLPESAPAPPELALPVRAGLESIQASAILEHVKALCGPQMKGREAGEKGARLAANYIAARFRKSGFAPGGSAGTYFQTFKIRTGYHVSANFQAEHAGKCIVFKRKRDYMPVHISRNKVELKAKCVVVGYGVSSKTLRFNEYADMDVNGAAVIVFSGVPWSKETAAWLWRSEKRSRDSLAYKAKTAAAHGASAVFIVDDPAGWHRRLVFSEQLRLPDVSFPVDSSIPIVHITRRTAAKLVGLNCSQLHRLAHDIRSGRKPLSFEVKASAISYQASIAGSATIGRNVVGVLPGADPKLRQESLVIGAHYNHLGEIFGEVYFGANDNAAGVGALLEMAAALKWLPEPPKRTIILVAFGAEEIGKLGSYYYTAHPCMAIDRCCLMVNFDMIGRNEPNSINAVATRSSDELHRVHLEANRYVGLELVHPQNLRLGRADHTAFYMAQVPVMYLFGGRHDGYHTSEDTIDKLVPAKIEKTARLAFLTAYMVAQRNTRILFTGEVAE